MKALVVEDDASIRDTLGMALDIYGHKATLVESGRAAMKALAEEWPDVLLLDLTLPGMAGDELYLEIEKRFGAVPPTIFVSAVHEGAARISHLSHALFLAKPYTLEQLVDALAAAAQHPGRKSPQPGLRRDVSTQWANVS